FVEHAHAVRGKEEVPAGRAEVGAPLLGRAVSVHVLGQADGKLRPLIERQGFGRIGTRNLNAGLVEDVPVDEDAVLPVASAFGRNSVVAAVVTRRTPGGQVVVYDEVALDERSDVVGEPLGH